jgi:patatin-like phospholipase/acyl hydrolase
MSYNIVCFCGGGIRGLLSATILEDLAHAYPNILTKTNLFAGTSTGAGIISWLLKGDPPADIIHHFLAQEVSFFSEPCTNPARPAYSIDKVVEGQVVLHGTKPLNAFSQGSCWIPGSWRCRWRTTRHLSCSPS